jgi:hypothetical protein
MNVIRIGQLLFLLIQTKLKNHAAFGEVELITMIRGQPRYFQVPAN